MPLDRVFALLFLVGRIAEGLVVRTSPGLQLSGSFGTHSNMSRQLQRTDTWDAGKENPLPPGLHEYDRELLGQGAFGRVYGISSKCGHGKLAVKVIKLYKKSEKDEIENEAKAMRLLSNSHEPFFLKFYKVAYFEYRRNCWAASMIMERAGSEDFITTIVSHHKRDGSLYSTNGHLSPSGAELLTIFVDVANALSVMHKKHMFHRDVKPDNVRVIDGHGILIDYGFTCSSPDDADSVVRDGLIKCNIDDPVGTDVYLPPECRNRGQFVKCGRKPQSLDVFALGVTLYVLFVGRFPPFPETRSQNYDISKDADFREMVPSDLQDLMQMMLDPKPKLQVAAIYVVTKVIKHMREHEVDYKTRTPLPDTAASKHCQYPY